MQRFSERNGFAVVPQGMRLEDVPRTLRNMLWNAINASVGDTQYASISYKMWDKFYKLPCDARPFHPAEWNSPADFTPSWQEIRTRYFKADWAQVYDHVEFLIRIGAIKAELINSVLSDECAAYRVIDGLICAITGSAEIEAIEHAIKPRERFQATAKHFQTALSHLSNRESPDLRNVVKESISAVEATAKVVSGKENATLGDALALLEKQGRVDGALKKGITAIYGWTNGPNGIRHAMTENPQQIDHEDAKFYLVLCSAFANYLEAVSIK